MRKFKNILSNFLLAVLILAVAATVIPRVLGIGIYAVQSGSMRPALQVGDLIYAVPAEFEEIQVGDIITYVLNEELTLVTHRVIAVDEPEQAFYTQGDANQTADGSPVYYENIVGVVRFWIPAAGYVLLFVSQTDYRITGGIILVLILILSLVKNRRRRSEISAQGLSKGRKQSGWWKQIGAGILLVLLGLAVKETALAAISRLAAEKINVFSVGEIKGEIEEPGVDPGEVGWGADTKPVHIRNDGDMDAAVRVLIVPVLKHLDDSHAGGDLGDLGAPEGEIYQMGDLLLYYAEIFDDGESDNWIFHEDDGYFYYKSILKPGETSEALLRGVGLREDADPEEYQELTVEVQVFADYLQTEGNALKQWGGSLQQDDSIKYSF